MEETLMGSSMREIGRNVQKLQRENKKLERYLKNIGTSSDTEEFRNNLRTEIHSMTALVKSLLSSIQDLKSQDSHHTSIKIQRLEQQFLDQYTTLSSLTKSIKSKLELHTPFQTRSSQSNNSMTNPFISDVSKTGGYDLANVSINNETIEYENHPNMPPEEHEQPVQTQAFIPQFDAHLDELEDREEAIHQMADDLTVLNSMYQDLHGLVNEQGEQIEVLSSNVEHAKDDVQSGAVHLDKAASHQRKYRKKMCIMLLILLIMGAVLTGVIYFTSDSGKTKH
eukprot:275732_1